MKMSLPCVLELAYLESFYKNNFPTDPIYILSRAPCSGALAFSPDNTRDMLLWHKALLM